MKEVRGRSTTHQSYFLDATIPTPSPDDYVVLGIEVEGACVILRKITESGQWVVNFGMDSVFYIDCVGDASFEFNTLNYFWNKCSSTPLAYEANYMGDCIQILLEETQND